MRRFGVTCAILAFLVSGCDLPSPAGPTAEELDAKEAALESGATDVEAAEAADAVAAEARPNPFAALFRPRQSVAADASTDVAPETEEGVVAEPGAAPEAEPSDARRGLAALFAPKSKEPQDADVPDDGLTREVNLLAGRITVRGADGYCIDPETVANGRRAGFVILASCHILSNGETGNSVEPALMTVSVGEPGSGRSLPSPSEIAATVNSRMVGGRNLGTFSLVLLETGGREFLDNGDDRHWRGAFSFRGRLVGLSLYAPAGSPLVNSDLGADLLANLRVAIENAS